MPVVTNNKKRKRDTIDSNAANTEDGSDNKRKRSGLGNRFRRVKEEEALAGFKGNQRQLDNSCELNPVENHPPSHNTLTILTSFSDAGTYGTGGWGAKASEVLIKVYSCVIMCCRVIVVFNTFVKIQTRGKSFRHEKTKKKRGTYRGGKIDFKVMSIKLD